MEELGPVFGPRAKAVEIPHFPTPWKVINKTQEPTQKAMLRRLYPEYQFLCSFAHGQGEASLFRAVTDSKITAQESFYDWRKRELLSAAGL